MIHKQLIRARASCLFRIGVLGGVFASFLAAQVENSRSILHSREFITNPSLLAHAQQTILIDNDSNPFEELVIRYELEEGAHHFCLSRTAEDLTDVVLKNVFGATVSQLPSYERCTTVELPGGIYELHFSRPSKHRLHSNRAIRVQVDPPSPPLADSNGYPIDGYWAIEMDPAINPSHRPGRLRAQPPFQHLLNDENLYGPVIGDFSSSVMDEYSLFRLLGGGVTYYGPAILQANDTYWSLNSLDLEGAIDYVIVGNACQFPQCTPSYTPTHIKDLGNNKFQIFYNNLNGTQSPFFFTDSGYAPSGLTVADPDHPPATFHVVFRFFPDGTQIGDLHQGEATLFQTCGYEGKAAVFAYGTADLTAVNSSATTIENSAKSIRLGNNTAILWRTPSSQFAAIAADTTCLPEGAAAPAGPDFEVLPLDALLSDSSSAAILDKKCVDCKLRDADLTNLDLDGWDLSGADLSGATLTNVKLGNVTLAGAILSGTKLSCPDFSGADQNHPTDLTEVDFSKVQWVQSGECKSKFRYTLLSVAKLPPSLWKYVDLSYAKFVDAKGKQLSSEAQPLDLSGTTLTGVSLEGAILDYAIGLACHDTGPPCPDLSQAALSGASLRHVDLSGGKLYGAQLNNANLDNANLSNAYLAPSPDGTTANLQGAFLRNVNLFQGKLSGANFTNANFYSSFAVGTGLCSVPQNGFTALCATASGANMFATNFDGAYLFGVDFTGAVIQGVNFENSFLAGANFASATLLADTSRPETSFSGAFLQGTNLNELTIQSGFSLKNAFVDFAPSGNTLTLKLSVEHTHFSGYWNTPGQSVCAQLLYNQPTTVPQTDGSVICPDGSQNGCGAANPDGSNQHWKSKGNISSFASYANNATYTPASSQPICQYDAKWIFPDSSLPGRNPASRHRPSRRTQQNPDRQGGASRP